MEYCGAGELFDFIRDNHTKGELSKIVKSVSTQPQECQKTPNEWSLCVQSMFCQLVDTVSWMHSHGVVHLDLSLENTMLASVDKNQANIKIIDFGVARFFEAKDKFNEKVGKVGYMAPEVCRCYKYKVFACFYFYFFLCVSLMCRLNHFWWFFFHVFWICSLYSPFPPFSNIFRNELYVILIKDFFIIFLFFKGKVGKKKKALTDRKKSIGLVYAKKEYSPEKADIWCLGVMLFMMLIGAPPYEFASPTNPAFRFIISGRLRDVLAHWRRLPLVSADALSYLFLIINYFFWIKWALKRACICSHYYELFLQKKKKYVMESIFKPESERITMSELRRHKYVNLNSEKEKTESKTTPSLLTKKEEEQTKYSLSKPKVTQHYTNGNAQTLTIANEVIPIVTTKKAKDISQLLRSAVGVENMRSLMTTIEKSIEDTKKQSQLSSATSNENPKGEGVVDEDNKNNDQCLDELKQEEENKQPKKKHKKSNSTFLFVLFCFILFLQSRCTKFYHYYNNYFFFMFILFFFSVFHWS
ncbi:calmodulin-dependent protein kinase [Reticulomyxa filosa]|uniref:non-specific serine/threonine protein kinase n=1 Tax=Reticulomyxa filosa TaxID=46433 RepID=X6M8F4_RETFI|nr:calmodulin-dependent protein kinase [Reticulomyxa filosa]|eukprot:ETO09305.1 calmodulin-dependent protein kinase [Reticulomyxa filosa]